MRQYHSIKGRYPHALVLFRLGDFYELFYEDAIAASRELQITLTSRNRDAASLCQCAGFPTTQGIDIARLLARRVQDRRVRSDGGGRPGKKLVRREVVRVITPGTATSLNVLEPKENNYLAAIFPLGGRKSPIGFAYADVTTGEFRAAAFSGSDAEEKLRDELHRLRPRKFLFPGKRVCLTRQPGRTVMRGTPGEVAAGAARRGRDTGRRTAGLSV